ncbi:MAG: hypothetical protein KME45_01285 [Stenomitos rutilans HA7619-LM2]|jgi:long-subunit fatty acid transport protein|nr:hypothetical protein [Stenomitos rutilans HA7619-LM2]
MARLKRSSTSVDKAERRIAGLKSINPALDLGKGLTIKAFSEQIEATRQRVAAYNTTLSLLDADRAAMLEAEKSLMALSEKMLLGVAFEYGKDSAEYEMAGGVRKSQRKRPVRKAGEKIAS